MASSVGTVATDVVTVSRAFQSTAEAYADRPALRTRDGAIEWTWGEYAERAGDGASGLSAIGLGRGDTMACLLSNRPEFHVADTAAMLLGAASFSVYQTYTAEQAEQVIGDAGSRILVTEQQFVETAKAVRDGGRTALETIVVVDHGADPSVIDWTELIEECEPSAFDLEASVAAIEPDDLLTLIYTSGTTGAPKGVQLTHRNVITQVAALSERLRFPGGIRAVSWLPMAHVAERLSTQYFPMVLGWNVTTCPDPKAVTVALTEVHPEYFFSPPRVWEKLRAAVLVKTGGEIPSGSAAQGVLEQLGFDDLRVAIVGAAPCAPETIEFWHALGIPLCELYGLSETTGVATVNPPDAVRVGSVGPALAGVEVELSDEGEVLIRGDVVMPGYRNLPDKTAETIDSEGWLHSGDVGIFDDDGYLTIVDRIKEIIINAAGKNMSPANIEVALKTSGNLIGQACCIGDGRPYNVALITLDPDAAQAFAARRDIQASAPEALATDEAVLAEVRATVERANKRLARVEQIKKFTVLPLDWIPDGDELTPTMKLKRKPIATKYAAEIERMYADGNKSKPMGARS